MQLDSKMAISAPKTVVTDCRGELTFLGLRGGFPTGVDELCESIEFELTADGGMIVVAGFCLNQTRTHAKDDGKDGDEMRQNKDDQRLGHPPRRG